MNYYERHLGDYAKDTAHLTMIEHGAYSLLLDRYYSTEQGIPNDQAHRVARARTREEKQAVDSVLGEFFVLVDGIWINRRCDEEITKAQTKIKAAQENGKRGGRPKSNPTQTKNKPSGFSVVSENETQEKAHQTPDTRHQLDKTNDDRNSISVSNVVVENPTQTNNPIQSRANELAIMLRKRGASLQSSDPNILEWATSGVTDAQALTALETAKQNRAAKSSTQPITASYLNAIILSAESPIKPSEKFSPHSVPPASAHTADAEKYNPAPKDLTPAQRKEFMHGII